MPASDAEARAKERSLIRPAAPSLSNLDFALMNASSSDSKRTPAFEVYVVGTKVQSQSLPAYLFRWAIAWLLFLRSMFRAWPWLLPVGPKVRIQVRERATGRVIYERVVRRDDERFGPTIRKLVNDVHELDFPSFLNKYRIPPR